jgi:membrane protein implicated in regulation of membrane protease activity
MDWIRDNLWAAWLAGAVLLGAAELASLDLVLLMLAVGALAGMGLDLAGATGAVQVIGAIAAAVAMLVLVRPNVVRKLHTGPDLQHGFAALVGKEGFATTDVSVHSGQIKLAGEIWTARPYDEDEVITEGAKVQVLEIKGATAYVVEVPQLGS